MIVHLGYVAACSRCGAHCQPAQSTARAARRAANQAGWKVLRGRRSCPACRSQSADATEHAVPNTSPPGTER